MQTSGVQTSGAHGFLALSDQDLLRQCTVTTQRGSGPGGQHRNKVETGVRIIHEPTDVRAEAFEERCQFSNKATAVKRLRMKLALSLRATVAVPPLAPTTDGETPPSPFSIPPQLAAILPSAKNRQLGPNHVDFPKGLSVLLDVLSAVSWSPAAAAKIIGCSTSQIVKIVAHQHASLALVNTERAKLGMGPLKAT